MTRWVHAVAALVCAAQIQAAALPSPEAAATIVVYNSKDPASKSLAEYYAAKRAISKDHLVGLACSKEEEISRQEFLVDIESPLRAQFTKSGWWQTGRDDGGKRIVIDATIRFVAIMRGVPMKIRPKAQPSLPEGVTLPPPQTAMEMLNRHDEASVDSELSALFALGHDLEGPLGNPYHRRFSPILQVPPTEAPLLVCRLDGPSDAIVRRMIDDSLAAEKNGLWGWAYLDGRNITSGSYAAGDEWITAAGVLMRKQGVPVIADCAPETLPLGFPVTDAAIYYGWYQQDAAGPFADAAMRFVPGAVAAHLHSFSASTVRSLTSNWAGPLLARGAAATVGNVYEPFLELTIHFDIFQDRLMSGLTLAESAYAASRVLSWMGVIFGDPLYRPYASQFSSSHLDGTPNIWEKYRSLVVAAGGDPLAATKALHQLATDTKSSIPLEALAQAQAAAGKFDAALATLAEAIDLAKTHAVKLRLVLEQVEILRRANRIAGAKTRIATALGDFRSEADQTTFGRVLMAIEPKPSATPSTKP